MSTVVAEVVLTSRKGISSVEEMARNCKLDDEKLGWGTTRRSEVVTSMLLTEILV